MALRRLRRSAALAAIALVTLVACGGETPEAQAPLSKSHGDLGDPMNAMGGGRSASMPPKPITSLKRADIKETIAQGLGVFLQNVAVEDWPVMKGDKFYGFKIRALNPEWGIDLKPGDVVTRINGVVPEKPEDADAAMRSLDKAKSLRVDYERDGKAKTLELPIVD